MQSLKPINVRRWRRSGGGHGAAAMRAALAVLAITGQSAACLAAEPITSLGSAFRPQAGNAAPIDVRELGQGERTGANPTGLRVVVSSPSRTLASIDGNIVRVGDTVNGMRVTQINQQGVTLVTEGGDRSQLMVAPAVVKRKPKVDAAHVSTGARQ